MTLEDDPLAWAHREMLMLLAGRTAERLATEGSGPGWRRPRRFLELLAFHESGHAIAALAVGRTVYGLQIGIDTSCVIGPTQQHFSGGGCRQGETPEEPPAAADGKPSVIETDQQRISRLAFCFAAGTECGKWRIARAVIREYRAKTETLLRRNWYPLQALAESLEKKLSLDREEVAAIVGRG